ncbi:MAG: alkaline phosphatase family protein [Bacteroidales bacterium]|nr:alkaline phosphatase family protein [Bacteroidales bacterium]
MKRNSSLMTGMFLLLTVTFYSYSQEVTRIPTEQPKLIIGMVISQMRFDYIYRYWDKLGENGIRKMIERGTFCSNTSFNYLFSQEGVGHATIMTGATPSGHGIVAKEWYLNLQDITVGNTEDNNQKTIGGSYEAGRNSPLNLMSTTFTDELRLSNNFRSKVISVSLDANPAVLSGGHTASSAYWFDPVTGNFITSSYYTDSLPQWVDSFNVKKLPDIYLDQEWNTILPLNQYTESMPDNNKYEEGFKGQVAFPYNLRMLSASTKKKNDYGIIVKTPFGNSLLKDFALTAINKEELGKDIYTDVLIVSFTSLEYIGNLFGPNSVEVEDAIIRLDREIAHFLEFIDHNIGKEGTLVFFAADHGVAQVPAYLNDMKIPVGYFNYHGAIMLLKSALNNIYGKGDWIKAYHSQQIYLNRTLIEDSRLSFEEFQNYVARFMLQFSGVANTVTAGTLQTTNFTSGIFKKIQNSYNQKNSGDVILNLKPGWVEKTGGTTNHNSSYAYDTRIPLIWYGWKIKRARIIRQVDITDIAPTIASFLHITYPNACTGNPVNELLE